MRLRSLLAAVLFTAVLFTTPMASASESPPLTSSSVPTVTVTTPEPESPARSLPKTGSDDTWLTVVAGLSLTVAGLVFAVSSRRARGRIL